MAGLLFYNQMVEADSGRSGASLRNSGTPPEHPPEHPHKRCGTPPKITHTFEHQKHPSTHVGASHRSAGRRMASFSKIPASVRRFCLIIYSPNRRSLPLREVGRIQGQPSFNPPTKRCLPAKNILTAAADAEIVEARLKSRCMIRSFRRNSSTESKTVTRKVASGRSETGLNGAGAARVGPARSFDA